MGDYAGKAIYYDRKTKEAVYAPKSFLLNTEGAKRTNTLIPMLVVLFMFSCTNLFMIKKLFNMGTYTEKTLYYIVLIWLIESIFLVGIVELALYKNVRTAKLATEYAFRQATFKNLISEQRNGKTEQGNIIYMKVLSAIILLLLLLPVVYVITYQDLIGKAIGNEIFRTIILGLVIPVNIIVFNQNSPVRFFKTMQLYNQNKIKFKEE
ncbi:hypothetical protein [Streptococcus pantholopis]|nr:hypothetical protein [Streptococcus pantholopis]